MTILVIVESPAKCKKIEGFLGPGYKCIASFGHIYQLDNVKNDENFKPEFKLLPSKSKYIKILKAGMKNATEVVLATDDDREGEAIAWHICRLGKLPIKTTKRIIFHEITKSAVQKAIKNPTVIDMEKVNAQLGRQVLDRLVGFTISPVLWKQFFHGGKKGGLSAGRCQTPALRLVYENQLEIDGEPGKKIFETTGYFTEKDLPFKLSKDFEEQKVIEDFLEESVGFEHEICKPKKPTISKRKAPIPFSTSSLQQRASNELHYSPKRTMQLAQKLYENGHITYMRTDNKKYSGEFIVQATAFIKQKWSVCDEYIKSDIQSITIGQSKKKVDNAQEAHEAIRPTKPYVSEVDIGDAENRLYNLIWTNTLESCMSDAQFNIITAKISAPMKCVYKCTADQVVFPGWMIVHGFEKENDLFAYIGKLKKKKIIYNKIYTKQNLKNLKTHFTEARLVQMLEKKGIGRPSTFSSLISKIQDRVYVKKEDVEGKEVQCTDYKLVNGELEEIVNPRTFGNEKNKLIMQPLGKMVIEFLLKQFDDLFVYKYTETMEKTLDDISRGDSKWQDLCGECNNTMKKLMKDIVKNKSHIRLDDEHVYMISKYGPVIKHEKDGKTTFKKIKKDIDIDKLRAGEYKLEDIIIEKTQFVGKSLGSFKNNEVIVKKGKFGLYMTCGGKNYSLKGLNENTIKLADVLDILLGTKSSNPKILKILNSNMSVRKGKFGPYLFYKTETMSKPRFFGMYQVFAGGKSEKFNWKEYQTNVLIDLVKENCL
tara:strand:+ start:2697 stop:4994 length:2298 start_codon:yes stop_codon:yes gene_type:complete